MLFKKPSKNDSIKWRLIGIAGKLLIDLIFSASTIHVRGREPVSTILASRQFIMAFWHSRILLISYVFKGWHAPILVSDSADGEIIAQILQRQGQITVRGSTRKGGMRALNQMIRMMRTHQPAGVVPDGPQGPRHKVQPGVIYLARKTGLPIVPVTYSAKRRLVANSWDRFVVPCPCSPCLLVFGRPVRVPSDGGTDQIQAGAQELEQELMRITTEADHHWGHAIDP